MIQKRIKISGFYCSIVRLGTYERIPGVSGCFPERLEKFCGFSQRLKPEKLRLSELSEFRNFGVMSVGKTKILRKKWRGITR